LHDVGVQAEVIGQRWSADPISYRKLRRHIRRVRPDIVHTWLAAAGGCGRRAAVAEGIARLVHCERRIRPRQTRWQRWLDRRLAARTTRLVTDSATVREHLIARGLPREKLVVIPGGPGPTVPSDVTRSELLEELRLPRDARLIGAIGRLEPRKRVKDLIWAAELESVLHPTIHLLVIGDGPQRGDLERFASLAASPGRVRFLGHRDDVWRILPHLDALWQGSDDEGFSNAVLEAMAAGVPVIATDTPGHRELVVPDETGCLVPIAGRAEYARATDRILSDVELAKRLGNAAQKRVVESFSAEQMARGYAEVYRDLAPTDANR
jgi:glycosyltransferase involved in cell wall biosynthesis